MPLKVVNEEVPKIAAREEKWDLVTSMDVMNFTKLHRQFYLTLASLDRNKTGIHYEIPYLFRLFGSRKTVEIKLDGYLALAEWRYELYLQLIADTHDCTLVPPWDVAIVFLAHLMYPARFLSDIFRRTGTEKVPLSVWTYPLAALITNGPGISDPHTESLWAVKYGSKVPFELYKYDQELYQVCGLLNGQVAARTTVTAWVPKATTDGTTPFTALGSRRPDKKLWTRVVCDLNVWSMVRTGILDLHVLTGGEEEESNDGRSSPVQERERWHTWKFQLGNKWDPLLVPRQQWTADEKQDLKTKKMYKLTSRAIVTTDDGSHELQQETLHDNTELFQLEAPWDFRGPCPCITVDVITGAKGFRTIHEEIRRASPVTDLTRESAQSCVESFRAFLSEMPRRSAPRRTSIRDNPRVPKPWASADIAWRAALLSPAGYQAWCARELAAFLDHDFDSFDGMGVREALTRSSTLGSANGGDNPV